MGAKGSYQPQNEERVVWRQGWIQPSLSRDFVDRVVSLRVEKALTFGSLDLTQIEIVNVIFDDSIQVQPDG